MADTNITPGTGQLAITPQQPTYVYGFMTPATGQLALEPGRLFISPVISRLFARRVTATRVSMNKPAMRAVRP